MMKIIPFILLICIFGCTPKVTDIKNGTFELYENDEFIGKIYRLNNFQIESYQGMSDQVTRIDFKTDSTYLLRGTEKVQIGIDTIVFQNKYKMISSNEFQIIAVPYNSDIKYEYRAVLKKVNDNVSEKYTDTLKYLNQNYKLEE